MLSTNNKTDVKKEERKYSWLTVFVLLYLKTIGRILLERWNKWAENILYYDKVTRNSGIQTDGLKAVDGSVQTDLKPEVAEKESATTSEDEGICSEVSSGSTDKDLSDTEVDGEFMDEDCDSMGEVSIKEDVSQELELERLQNVLLKEENRELKSTIKRLEKNYKELAEDAGKREKELIECNTESANRIKRLLAEMEEKESKVDEQQQIIFYQNKIIREKEDGIEATRKDNESLQVQIVKSKIRLKDKYDKLNELSQQLRTSKLVALLRSKTDKLEQARDKNIELENKVSELDREKKILQSKLQSAEEPKQQLEGKEIDLEGKLKDLSSQLSASGVENERLKNEATKLQKQVQTLEGNKENVQRWKGSSHQANMKLVDKNEAEVNGKEDIGKRTKRSQGQTKAQERGAVLRSTVPTAKSTTTSLLSSLIELKKSFPEFKEKHLSHNVLNRAIEYLKDQADLENLGRSKFEISEMLKFLENSSKRSSKEIIYKGCKNNVDKYFTIEVNDITYNTLEKQLSLFFAKLSKEFECNAEPLKKSVLDRFKPDNNDIISSLKQIIIEELANNRMVSFAHEVKKSDLPLSIRDKFLSPDQKMCNQICGKGNVYQLRAGINKTNDMPNSLTSRTSSTVSIHSLNSRRAVRTDF